MTSSLWWLATSAILKPAIENGALSKADSACRDFMINPVFKACEPGGMDGLRTDLVAASAPSAATTRTAKCGIARNADPHENSNEAGPERQMEQEGYHDLI